ncbi:MAG: glycosyltransferase family 2 protein [Patescibacteria group bacterium]
MKLCVIMPAYNEASVIADVIRQIPKKIMDINNVEVIVVNDNSTDNTSRVAKEAGAVVLNHRLNLGAGGATMTGLEYARRNNFDVAVTMDSDGQHDPSEIKKLVKRVLSGYDLVIGSRLLGSQRHGMPLIKWIGNNAFNVITFLFYGVWVTDSQSGFKAFSKKAMEKCQVESVGYEICSALIGKAKAEHLRICEEPIKIIYTDYSKRKGQHYLNGFNIVIRLALSKIRGSL